MDKRFEDRVPALLDRRFLLGRAGALTVAATLLPMLGAGKALAITTLEVDPRQKAETVAIPGGPANLKGYLVLPTAKTPARKPAVILVGDNRGLNVTLKDMARRFATDGFVALAVDVLSPTGGTPADPQAAAQGIGRLKAADVAALYKAATKYLKSRADVGKIGAVGFGWGGAVVNDLAAEDASIGAAVTYYAPHPDLKGVGRVRVPLQAHYAALDNTLLQGVPAYDSALSGASKKHAFYIYPGANSGFMDDSNAARWDPVSTEIAWGRTVDFCRQNLR